MFELPISEPYLWILLGIILGVAEIVMPGFFLIWIGGAALLTGLLAWQTGMGIVAQLIAFAVLSLMSLFVGKRWFAIHPIESSAPQLNDISARLVGERAMVVEEIVNGSGRVKIGDSVWLAYGADTPVGTPMRVTALERGGVAVVRG